MYLKYTECLENIQQNVDIQQSVDIEWFQQSVDVRRICLGRGRNVKDISLNVKALAAMQGLTIEELADKAGINFNHLKFVSCGRVKMTAKDIKLLAKATGVPAENIAVE